MEESRAEILKRDGWTRQFIADEPRLSEAVDMYKEAGFEVHLEPLPKPEKKTEAPKSASEGKCRQCFEGIEDRYKVIFTRPRKDAPGSDELS